jgi:hypothetical protein
MASVPAAYPEGSVPRIGLHASRYRLGGRAGKSLLICRSPCLAAGMADGSTAGPAGRGSRASGHVATCIFLLNPRRAALAPTEATAWRGMSRPVAACIFLLNRRDVAPAARPLTGSTPAAPHKSVVNNNENTSAPRSSGTRDEARNHWHINRNRRLASACAATRARTIKLEQARRTPAPRIRGRFYLTRAAGHGSHHPSFIVNPCKSLLIRRGPARKGSRIHASHLPEPVRSGGSRARPHGHGPSCRPPSPLVESGGRP